MVFGLVCLVGYVLYSRYTSRPLFSPDLFKIRTFRSAYSATSSPAGQWRHAVSDAAPFANRLGYSPMKAGLSMIPMTVGALISKSAATRLVNRFGYRLILTVNTLLLGLMIGLFSTIDKTMNYWLMMASSPFSASSIPCNSPR